MGSEGPSVVSVHVTGFKKFHGVGENPTETIVNNLKEFMQKKGLPKGLLLESCTILETAGEGALPRLYELMESTLKGRDAAQPNLGRTLLLHFGVNSGATRFAIENQAVNEATFRCPDELGWKPQRLPVVEEDGSISRIRKVEVLEERSSDLFFPSTSDQYAPFLPQTEDLPIALRKTALPVIEITQALAKKGYSVAPSDDAGRFVCNYVYYHSLRFAAEHGIKSLFVHVPLFLTINEDTQMQFAASLVEALPAIL